MPSLYMPRLDPVMEEGTIVEWLKKEGEKVRKGEVIAVVEGEKTTFELESPYDGVLVKIIRGEGETVKVGEVIAEVEAAPTAEEKIEVKASPAARKLAKELGVKLEEVEGTGPGGRITREDVLRFARERGLKPEEKVEAERVPFAGVRKAISERLRAGFHEAIPVALMTEFWADELVKHRESHGNPSFTAYLVKAAAQALRKHPNLNITLEKNEIVRHRRVNIAVAVDTPKGLMAPVIRDADKLSLHEITKLIDEFQKRGARGEIKLEEQTGHSFTVTNLGAQGVTYFTPVINPPDAAILALGRIDVKPHIGDDGKVEARKVSYLTLVFDHRLVDGAPAAEFLQTVRRLMENPEETEG